MSEYSPFEETGSDDDTKPVQTKSFQDPDHLKAVLVAPMPPKEEVQFCSNLWVF